MAKKDRIKYRIALQAAATGIDWGAVGTSIVTFISSVLYVTYVLCCKTKPNRRNPVALVATEAVVDAASDGQGTQAEQKQPSSSHLTATQRRERAFLLEKARLDALPPLPEGPSVETAPSKKTASKVKHSIQGSASKILASTKAVVSATTDTTVAVTTSVNTSSASTPPLTPVPIDTCTAAVDVKTKSDNTQTSLRNHFTTHKHYSPLSIAREDLDKLQNIQQIPFRDLDRETKHCYATQIYTMARHYDGNNSVHLCNIGIKLLCTIGRKEYMSTAELDLLANLYQLKGEKLLRSSYESRYPEGRIALQKASEYRPPSRATVNTRTVETPTTPVTVDDFMLRNSGIVCKIIP